MKIRGVELSGAQFELFVEMVGDCELDNPFAPDGFQVAVALFVEQHTMQDGAWVERPRRKESKC